MFPASYNNYGLEFNNLLVIPSTPNVLIIANSDGLLHHCIVMENMVNDQSIKEEHSAIEVMLLKHFI